MKNKITVINSTADPSGASPYFVENLHQLRELVQDVTNWSSGAFVMKLSRHGKSVDYFIVDPIHQQAVIITNKPARLISSKSRNLFVYELVGAYANDSGIN